MGRLTLVRHGQASFLSGDYDRLSPLGIEQARALAAHWLGAGRRFDRIYTGSLRRQVHTATIVGEAFRAADARWPEPVVLTGLDEFPAEELMRRLVPQLARKDESIRALHSAYRAATEDDARHDAAFRLLETVNMRWMSGDCDTGTLPTWRAFRIRVRETLATILGDAHGREIAAFTSGGVIGACLESLRSSAGAEASGELHASGDSSEQPDGRDHLREVSDAIWRLRNCSLTELVIEDGRVSVGCYDSVPHLPPGLHTLR
jgi:broad specificity phosphatase PhoE